MKADFDIQERVYSYDPTNQKKNQDSIPDCGHNIQCVPLATEPGISLTILPLMRKFEALQTHTTDTFLFISHTTNLLLFKFLCNIFIIVRIIKEMPGSVSSGTLCISYTILFEIISYKTDKLLADIH